ncbi:MAG: FixH family protein [Ktedonobacteraceae bacterium]|nr:FixH family protein [Ktedonobacteraceae bacterium]
MRRRLLILALGVGFLIITTWLATMLNEVIPYRSTTHIQTAQAGPYQITLQVDPNPPLPTQPAVLTLRVARSSSQQPVTQARVTLDSSMETMDMSNEHAEAQLLPDGTYQARVQFSMSGPWQVRVSVVESGQQVQHVVFEITAQ